jgi:hypothetical protein
MARFRFRRRSKNIAAIVTCLLLSSAVYNHVTEARERARYPQVGRSVDVGGRSLNLYCSGEPAPTVVFDTFSHQAGLSWISAQARTSQFARSCWYDRAGYGWSDPGPQPRTFKAVATDLHLLLHAANVPAPYVFVGAHDAVSNIRLYHKLYPNDVAAVVMIDGNDIDEYAHRIPVPEEIQGPVERYFGSLTPYARRTLCAVLPIARLLTKLIPKLGKTRRPTLAYGFPSERRTELDFLSDRSTGESCDVQQNVSDLEAAGDFDDRPLIVLASRHPQNAPSMQAWNEWRMHTAQPGLAALSTKGRLIIIEDRVELDSIVEAVREAAAQVRLSY